MWEVEIVRVAVPRTAAAEPRQVGTFRHRSTDSRWNDPDLREAMCKSAEEALATDRRRRHDLFRAVARTHLREVGLA